MYIEYIAQFNKYVHKVHRQRDRNVIRNKFAKEHSSVVLAKGMSSEFAKEQSSVEAYKVFQQHQRLPQPNILHKHCKHGRLEHLTAQRREVTETEGRERER